VQGLVDPRAVGEPGQAEQWQASVTATCALVRSLAESGIDVAVDDLMLPADAQDIWQPMLNGLSTHLVVVLPSLEDALARGRSRDKHMPEHLVTSQHGGSARWPRQRQLNTTGQTVGLRRRPPGKAGRDVYDREGRAGRGWRVLGRRVGRASSRGHRAGADAGGNAGTGRVADGSVRHIAGGAALTEAGVRERTGGNILASQ